MERGDDGGQDLQNGDRRDADATPEGATVTRQELEAAGREAPEFTREDEIHDVFVPEPLFTPLAPDGLPNMAADHYAQGAPPPLTYDTVVCVEDDRQYVEVWYEEASDSLEVAEVLGHSIPAGVDKLVAKARPRWDQDGVERERRVFDPGVVVRRWGLWVAPDPDDATTESLVLVRPVRPVCRFYKRQVWAESGTAPGEPGHLDIHRNCTARRSVGGAFLGLADQAVYCCEYRQPPDERSAQMIADRDQRVLDGRLHLRLVPAFGTDGEERDIAPEDDPWTLGGIFGRAGRKE